jgi:hypothetical protein
MSTHRRLVPLALCIGSVLCSSAEPAHANKALLVGKARLNSLLGRHEQAATLFKEAGDDAAALRSTRSAADSLRSKGAYVKAALLYRKLGDRKAASAALTDADGDAVERYKKAGNLLKAGTAQYRFGMKVESREQMRIANHLYLDAGQQLEQQGEHRQAGRAYANVAKLNRRGSVNFNMTTQEAFEAAARNFELAKVRGSAAFARAEAKDEAEQLTARFEASQREAALRPKPEPRATVQRDTATRSQPGSGVTVGQVLNTAVDAYAGYEAGKVVGNVINALFR